MTTIFLDGIRKEARARAIQGLIKNIPGTFKGRTSLFNYIDDYLKGIKNPDIFSQGSKPVADRFINALRTGNRVNPKLHGSLLQRKRLSDIIFIPHAQRLTPYAEREARTMLGGLARQKGLVPKGFS